MYRLYCSHTYLLYTLKNLIFLFTLLYISSPVFCQEERKPLKGKIKSDAEDLEGIYVINKTADLSVATARGGYFTIDVKPKDTLIFSAVNFIGKEIIVEQENIDSELFFVEMEVLVTQLKEVIIEDYSHINEESLGLVPKGQKQYTQAEKKLFTASNGVDGLFNAISGRKKALKKAVVYESKRMLMAKINYIYTEEEIIGIIHNGRGSGMPKGLLKGEDAEAVAAWLATMK